MYLRNDFQYFRSHFVFRSGPQIPRDGPVVDLSLLPLTSTSLRTLYGLATSYGANLASQVHLHAFPGPPWST